MKDQLLLQKSWSISTLRYGWTL